MVCILHGYYDAQPKMRFSLSPPPPKAPYMQISPSNMQASSNRSSDRPRPSAPAADSGKSAAAVKSQAAVTTADDAASDYNQWLHAMKLVARLPGGMPPEFRRKLWLSLADKYLKSKNVDWAKEEEKCFCEKWREDDEELGIQIVKDLHRTGSNLCTGPAGSINQAKLKRILLGYARYNPEVGYCQGFNMLGALILQVMDKEESESIKVMIYLVEGVLPTGYFCGSMGGLQADMGVFRDLMQTKLPRLAKHLQKLQGPIENAYEPPLTNVFTMQWFLTMFCTCLPMTCVLRVWDLVLIEGSDVLLRTALVLWSLLEERVLKTRTADDFYCKMGSFSSELLNGHLIDSNGLIEKVVLLGPIADLQKLRDKHLYNIAPLRHKQGLQLYFDDEELESDEESRLAVATVWGLPWGRRGSQGQSVGSKQVTENKDRLALDISLLKKQYDRLRERQQQAHIILTTACSTARQSTGNTSQPTPINQLLVGRSAIMTNKGKRIGPPPGAIPPVRKPSLPTVLHTRPPEKQLRRGETLHWRDTDLTKRRRDSLTWKEIKADRASILRDGPEAVQTNKLRARVGKSDSSSYSEDSDGDGSSTDTSLCDEDDPVSTGDKTRSSSIESSPRHKSKSTRKTRDLAKKLESLAEAQHLTAPERVRPKSWAPTNTEIPFMLMVADSPVEGNEKGLNYEALDKEAEEDSATESDRLGYKRVKDVEWADTGYSSIAGDLATMKLGPLHVQTDVIELPVITSTSQLSPMPDISTYLNNSAISPLPTPKPLFLDSTNSLGSGDGDDAKKFDVGDDGVTNEYFERVNSVERPTKLDLFYSLNEEDSIRTAYDDEPYETNAQNKNPSPVVDGTESTLNSQPIEVKPLINLKTSTESPEFNIHEQQTTKLVDNCFESSSSQMVSREKDKNITEQQATEHKQFSDDHLIVKNNDKFNYGDAALRRADAMSKTMTLDRKEALSKKRRDPRRLTLTRSTTIEIEERFEALEKHMDDTKKCERPPTEPERTHKLPSTADLEERFHTLEKQLTQDKENHMKRCADGKGSRVYSDHPSPKGFSSSSHLIETQKCSDKSGTETPLKLKKDNNEDGDKFESKKTKREQEEQERFKEQSEKSETQTSAQKFSEGTGESTKPRLTKLPSTAELEDRFNALERKMSTQNSSPTKTKKEPPDAYASKETNRKEKGRNVPDDVMTKEPTENKRSLDLENKRQVSVESALPHREESKEIKKISTQVDGNDTKMKTATVKSDTTEQSKQEKDKRKPPPSTAELEKRFNALERQLSSASLEMKSKESTKPEHKKESDGHKTKSFEDKCKSINEELTMEKTAKDSTKADLKTECEDLTKSPTSPLNGKKAQKECTEINQKDTRQTECKEADKEKVAQDLHMSKRRASEPPSTEDLEKRYESLKRRMSSKVMTEKTLAKAETVEEALQRIEKEIIEEIAELDGDKAPTELEQTKAISENITTEGVAIPRNAKAEHKKTSTEPPSTEDLESRYEALQRKSSSVKETVETNKPPLSPKTTETHQVTTPRQEEQKKSIRRATQTEIEPIETTNDFNEIDPEVFIPAAPPMPKHSKAEHFFDVVEEQQRRALIREFQSKIRTQPNDMNIRPSDINPNRRPPPTAKSVKRDDETSETHADTAFYRSRNYEPWIGQPNKMVRRFSDLPSRADLENRLQFLETQLSKKFSKQRCAGDSEVASMKQLIGLQNGSYQDELPSTSSRHHYTEELERRVQALEKQLSENSLKMLEAARIRAEENAANNETPRKLSTETIDATGKELVRYTHTGELEETETHKPINISINIKMLLNKDTKEKPTETSSTLTTEEITKRLEMLEKQLKESRIRNEINNEKCEETLRESNENESIKRNDTSEETKIQTTPTVKEEPNEIVQIDMKEIRKETQNDTKYTDKNRIEIEEQKEQKKEITKQEKDLENEEILNSNKIKSESFNVALAKEQDIVVQELKETIPLEKVETKPDNTQDGEKKEAETAKESTAKISPTVPKTTDQESPQAPTENMVIDASNIGPVDPSNKTLVLLLDNEPKAVKVRRLTRANTEELEGLFQALEKQLNDRNLIKCEDGKLKRADNATEKSQPTEESKAIANLSKEIQNFTSSQTTQKENKTPAKEEQFDWGPDPVKRHLKRKTAYLPSTKELEARFRSLERQIKMLEDVEKIDVEQRLNEIERKIKLQYSLAHEKDLTRYLELCEGKGLDDDIDICSREPPPNQPQTPTRSRGKSPHTSPSRAKSTTPHTSPTRTHNRRSPYTSPSRASKHSPYTSPVHQSYVDEYDSNIPETEELEYRYRALELKPSRSKENLSSAIKKRMEAKKQAIHPLEILLDPSPDDTKIPTTGELEHRIRVLDEKRKTPTTPPKSRSRSPKTPTRTVKLLVSPTRHEPPTEDELEARMRALEDEHSFDFKMQKNFKEFNQKLKDVISPSLSFEEFKSKSREQSPKHSDVQRSTTPKSALRETDNTTRADEYHPRSTSPKVIRFREDEVYRPRSRTEACDAERTNTLADSSISSGILAASTESLDAMGTRLMRETSPLRRTGTHTGVPLRTDDNINDRLNSIKNTIKSIDTLCEEKPYRKEKCQRYIDSLFADSVHFANPHKKTSLEDLTHSESRPYMPSIRVSDHSQRPSDYYLSRSMGSAESIRSTSPLRAASPLHHRSTRDLRRDISPRHRRDEDREEYESRVRRDYILPNNFLSYTSDLSSSSLTKFHKVDRQLDTYKYDERERSSSRSASRSPLRSPYGSREMMIMPHYNTTNTYNTTTKASSNRLDLDRPSSPYRQISHNLLGYDNFKRSNTPVYNPSKLEIRHTTVTSTFYDRLLTEKEIERTLSRPPSRSPIVSPSNPMKSCLDIPIDSANISLRNSKENSPTTNQVHSGTMGLSGLGIESSCYTPKPNNTTSTYSTITSSPYTASSYSASMYTTTQNLATTPTAGTGAAPTASTITTTATIMPTASVITTAAENLTTATTAVTANTTNVRDFSSLYNPSSNIPSLSSNILSTTTTINVTTTNTTLSTLSSITSLYSSGTYKPLVTLNLQETTGVGLPGLPSLGLYTSALNNNTTASSYANPTTELPKS